MFYDIKDKIDSQDVRRIMALSAFDSSAEAMERAAELFRRHTSRSLYGWVENGKILGVCGFEVHADKVEILNIAVAENAQRRGIGRSIINSLHAKYKLPLEAETDDDAVDFYRKTGFITSDFRKYNVRRWACVLPAE